MDIEFQSKDDKNQTNEALKRKKDMSDLTDFFAEIRLYLEESKKLPLPEPTILITNTDDEDFHPEEVGNYSRLLIRRALLFSVRSGEDAI